MPDRDEIDAGQARDPAVVVAHDRYVVGYRDPRADEGVQHAESTVVIEGDNSGGQRTSVQEKSGCRRSRFLGMPAGDDPGKLGQAVPTHGGALATTAGSRNRAATAINVDDLAMAKPNQVIDGRSRAR